MRSNQDPALLRAFAAEVKALRLRLEISQEMLANQSGINRSFMGKVEVAETSPSLTSLYRMAKGLHVAPHLLIRAVSRRYLKEKLDLRSTGSAKLSATKREAVGELLGEDVSFFFSEDDAPARESLKDKEFYQAYLKLKPGAKEKVRQIFEILDRSL
jgi:transcriptional regulator with XRE-family HTH domain